MSANPFPRGQYGVILADPPWQYEMRSDKGYGRSPDAHYGCLPLEAIKAMRDDVVFAAGPDCVLFMWAVYPMLPQALELMDAWGFRFKTGGAWHKKTRHGKTAFGTGYILRSACEPFLIGTLGQPEIMSKSSRNIIEAEVREHSRKPDEAHVLIERTFRGPYLEMFGRQRRPGWDVWGNQVDLFEAAA
jgi:N6-adenosine-specific RNA methylase IME4